MDEYPTGCFCERQPDGTVTTHIGSLLPLDDGFLCICGQIVIPVEPVRWSKPPMAGVL